MPRILTVDDSMTIRSFVRRALVERGFELEEAEDGQKGLEALANGSFDLVLLDVTMPVMDGPTMLAEMRAGGDKTPVLMLTSESKTSIVASCMKVGIDDYILKPFKPEDLVAKVQKSLGIDNAAMAAAALGVEAPAAVTASEAGPAAAGSQFVDLLVIDDMENVNKKLRSMLPSYVTVNSSVSAQTAIAMCRDKVYRVVLIDLSIPDVDSVALMNQLRALQPHAAFVALALRTQADSATHATEAGFGGHLFKPFDVDSIDDFLFTYFDRQDIVETDDNIVKVGELGNRKGIDRYFDRVAELSVKALETVAAACHETVIVDLAKSPPEEDQIQKVLIRLKKSGDNLGLDLRVIGTETHKKCISAFVETDSIPFFYDLSSAQAA